jgi:biopolymer transport protein TolR
MPNENHDRASSALADINVTPFIDVLLVLLIIFMIVTPVSLRSLDTALPNEGEPGREGSLVLEIADDGLTLNQTPILGPNDLDTRLRDLMSSRVDKTLFVRVVAANLLYGQVVDVLDVARGAGAERIGFMPAATVTR